MSLVSFSLGFVSWNIEGLRETKLIVSLGASLLITCECLLYFLCNQISDDGEAFICQPNKAKTSPVKIESNGIYRSASISSKSTESEHAQSPPTSSLLSNISKGKDDTLAQAFPNVTPLSLLLKDSEKKDKVVEYSLERIPLVHRGQRIFTDTKSRGFAVLQVASKEGFVLPTFYM